MNLRMMRAFSRTSGDEFLSAESGFDAHDQQGVEVAEDLQVRLERGARLDRQPGLRTGGPDVAGDPDRILGGLRVEGDVVGAGLGVRRRPTLRVLDHQMAVERDVGRLQQALHDRQTQGQVRHEVVVHDIDVQPVGAGGTRLGDRRRLVGEIREVRGQDGRGRSWARYQRCTWWTSVGREGRCGRKRPGVSDSVGRPPGGMEQSRPGLRSLLDTHRGQIRVRGGKGIARHDIGPVLGSDAESVVVGDPPISEHGMRRRSHGTLLLFRGGSRLQIA